MKKLNLSLTIFISLIMVTVFSLAVFAYNEAPMLKEKVEGGSLPPVDERLPDDPYVVGPGDLILEEDLDWEPGQYGGTLRMARANPGFDPHVFIGSNEPILWAPACFNFDKGIQGNIVKGVDINDDNTEFVFHMREGLKWSDGHPVTTADVRFAYEDVMLNEKITPIFPVKYRDGATSDGEPMILEIIDDYTFKITFENPYGTFPAELAIAGWVGYSDLIKPSHYLKQFHIDYTSLEDMKPYLEEEELGDDWGDLFTLKDIENWDLTNQNAVDFPVLYPWRMVQVEGGLYVYERNPYYFKVDTEGNQLPYIDTVRTEEVSDNETYTMKAMVGEIDYLGERASLKNLPLFKQQQQKEDIKILIPQMHRTPYTAYLNLTYDDQQWREVVRDVRFRRALNMAIDREEIIEVFYYGFASKPDTVSGEFNPEKAEELLDEMGLDQKDENGWRLYPNGDKLELYFEVTPLDEDIIPITELLCEYWKDIGIDADFKKIERALYGTRVPANELQATAAWLSENMWRSGGWNDYLPQTVWAPTWITWYNTNGEEGEEPPVEVKKLWDLHSEFVKTQIGTEESNQIMDKIYQHHYENVFLMNIVEDSSYPTILNPDLGNIPPGGQWNELGIVLMYSPEQWFFKSEN